MFNSSKFSGLVNIDPLIELGDTNVVDPFRPEPLFKCLAIPIGKSKVSHPRQSSDDVFFGSVLLSTIEEDDRIFIPLLKGCEVFFVTIAVNQSSINNRKFSLAIWEYIHSQHRGIWHQIFPVGRMQSHSIKRVHLLMESIQKEYASKA